MQPSASKGPQTRIIYGVLLLVWVAILAWQIVEHIRVRQAVSLALRNRAKDISNTVGLVLRSQRRFGGMISRERVESALGELVKPGELDALALLNAGNEVVASAGTAIDFERIQAGAGESWTSAQVALVNLVDLGTNVAAEAESPSTTIVVPRNEMFNPFGTNRPAGPPVRRASDGARAGDPPTNNPAVMPPPFPAPESDDATNAARAGRPPGRQGPRWEGRARFGRPFGMSEDEYKTLLLKQGVHSFVIVLSTQAMWKAFGQDAWLRGVIVAMGSISVIGLGLAWRNLSKSSELEVRLVRAAELNTRLKQMNLAAAGLAHETRNPLNIIRGLAQMVSRQPEASSEVRQKSVEIIDEADRVAAQLNEFINYTRPRELRRTTVDVSAVAREVARALTSDVEDKRIRLQIEGDSAAIEADEALLRQALFNLLLNAIQAVGADGEITIAAGRAGSEGSLEVRDNGPGVAPEHRMEIFQPYFTTHQKGTGLGLAVVHQIVLAHGWEIECLPNTPQGAVFRITHLRLAAKPATHAD